MFTADQYRAKAAKYAEMATTALSLDESSEFNKLQQSFTELADNEQWVADHHNQTLHATEDGEADEVTSAAHAKVYPGASSSA